ncbi:MAG: FAD-dependent oxidoreductase [Candidatus Acidiferrum sp.]|jgi:glutamate synthase (NADPH/NADH) small chain
MSLHEGPKIAERFAEVHPPLGAVAALAEANRCLYCFDAPCAAACPTHIDVPRFIKKISQENLRGSALTILDANILGASCARVCPVEVLCEGACVFHRYNQEPIQIGLLQRHAMDAFFADGPVLPNKATAQRVGKVACIGAGPASLACAAELRLRGYEVKIFERRELPGGLNTHGVAEYKLRASESLREIEMIRGLGVEFAFGAQIGGETALAELEKEYEFIFIGVGLGEMRKLGIAGEQHQGLVNALEFIEGYKTGGRVSVGRRVVVIGAGNTGIDAARAAMRLGAEEVQIIYRRGPQQMAAFEFEYEDAQREGVHFRWHTQPVCIHAKESGGGIAALECRLVKHHGSGAGEIEFVPGSAFRIPCEMVITAIGQSPLLELLQSVQGVRLENGRVLIDRATGRTANAKYFAGGDCVNGGREVVDAVADGKRSAVAIAQMLEEAHVGKSQA